MIKLYTTVCILDMVLRGSLLSSTDKEYDDFIKSSKVFVVIKINSDRILIQNKEQKSMWFYIDQITKKDE